MYHYLTRPVHQYIYVINCKQLVITAYSLFTIDNKSCMPVSSSYNCKLQYPFTPPVKPVTQAVRYQLRRRGNMGLTGYFAHADG